MAGITIVLFGAGASYGSGGVLPYDPPLGDGLLDKLAAEFPQTWGELAKNGPHSAKFDDTAGGFEKGMKAVWDEQGDRSDIKHKLLRDMALYFLKFKINNPRENAYCFMIEKLCHTSIWDSLVLSTLNYEVILELALIKSGYGISYGFADIRGTKGTVKLLKLHGSANFIDFGFGNFGSSDLAVVNSLSVESTGACDPDNAVKLLAEGSNPAIAAYMEGKPFLVRNGDIDSLNHNLWPSAIASSERIAICGVRYNHDDSHIWRPITRASARVGYVGDSDSYNYIKSQRIDRETIHLGKRFQLSLTQLIQFCQSK